MKVLNTVFWKTVEGITVLLSTGLNASPCETDQRLHVVWRFMCSGATEVLEIQILLLWNLGSLKFFYWIGATVLVPGKYLAPVFCLVLLQVLAGTLGFQVTQVSFYRLLSSGSPCSLLLEPVLLLDNSTNQWVVGNIFMFSMSGFSGILDT